MLVGVPTVTRIGVRSAEAGERADDHSLLEQPLEERRRVLAELDVDEVADRARGTGSRPCFVEDRGQLVEACRVQLTATGDLVGVAEARECRHLRGGRDVEGAAHLRHRLADVLGADRVADAEPGEAVDLRERAEHDHAPAGLKYSRPHRDSRRGRCTRSRPGRSRRARRPGPGRRTCRARPSCSSSRSGCSGGRRTRASSAA